MNTTRLRLKPYAPKPAPTEIIPVSHLSREDLLTYHNAAAGWGDPADTLELIEEIAEQLGVTRAEATRVFLIHHGK